MKWIERFHTYKRIVEEQNDAHPQRGCIENGIDWGSWACNQRALYKKGKLTNDKIELLESIGFRWIIFERKKGIKTTTKDNFKNDNSVDNEKEKNKKMIQNNNNNNDKDHDNSFINDTKKEDIIANVEKKRKVDTINTIKEKVVLNPQDLCNEEILVRMRIELNRRFGSNHTALIQKIDILMDQLQQDEAYRTACENGENSEPEEDGSC